MPRLFSGPPLSAVLDRALGNGLAQVNRISTSGQRPCEENDTLSDAEVAVLILERHGFHPPTVQWGDLTISTRSILVLTSTALTGGPATLVPGVRVSFTVPFSGSTAVLAARPRRHYVAWRPNVNARGNETNGMLTFALEGRQIYPGQVQRHRENLRMAIDAHLEYISLELSDWRRDAVAATELAIATRDNRSKISAALQRDIDL